MMRFLATLGVATALLLGAAVAGAEELKSGLQVGQPVPAFQVVNCGGSEDGVKVGKQLCYR